MNGRCRLRIVERDTRILGKHLDLELSSIYCAPRVQTIAVHAYTLQNYCEIIWLMMSQAGSICLVFRSIW